MTTLKTILANIAGAPFLSDAKFYFSVFNALVIFSQRLNFNFNVQEIAAVNLLIAVIFGVAAPTVQFMRVKASEAQAEVKRLEALDAIRGEQSSGAATKTASLEPTDAPFQHARQTSTPRPPLPPRIQHSEIHP